MPDTTLQDVLLRAVTIYRAGEASTPSTARTAALREYGLCGVCLDLAEVPLRRTSVPYCDACSFPEPRAETEAKYQSWLAALPQDEQDRSRYTFAEKDNRCTICLKPVAWRYCETCQEIRQRHEQERKEHILYMDILLTGDEPDESEPDKSTQETIQEAADTLADPPPSDDLPPANRNEARDSLGRILWTIVRNRSDDSRARVDAAKLLLEWNYIEEGFRGTYGEYRA